MDDWFTKLPLTDDLSKRTSGVFQVAKKAKHGDLDHCYWCQLCSSHDESSARIPHDEVQAHLYDPVHKNLASALLLQRKLAVTRFEWARQFSRDLDRYRCPEWESMVCRYVFVGGGESSKADIAKRQRQLKAAEPMVHLELALWKAACEGSPQENVVHPWEWKAWYGGGWKRRKPTTRRDPLTCIPALVAPFLGLTKPASSAKSG
jgi:hypothetical protein